MSFVDIEGIKGKLFVPDEDDKKKKHPCRDCNSCQFCSDERCALCLKKGGCEGCLSKKKSDKGPV